MKKGEAKRQEIIRLSAPVFNQRGFEGSSMLDIMQATGLPKGGIYRHFSSKQELATEAFRYALGQAMEARASYAEQNSKAPERLRYMVRAFIEKPSPIPGGCPMLNIAVDADDTNPELRNLAREGFRNWKGRIAKIVDDGILSGDIRKHTDPARIANQIVAHLEGALVISRLEGTKEALLHAQESLSALIDSISLERSAPNRQSPIRVQRES